MALMGDLSRPVNSAQIRRAYSLSATGTDPCLRAAMRVFTHGRGEPPERNTC